MAQWQVGLLEDVFRCFSHVRVDWFKFFKDWFHCVWALSRLDFCKDEPQSLAADPWDFEFRAAYSDAPISQVLELGQTACPVRTPGQGACPVGEGKGSDSLSMRTLWLCRVLSIREVQGVSGEMCTNCFLTLSRLSFQTSRILQTSVRQCLHWSWHFHFVPIHWDVQGWLTCACAGLERLIGSAWLAKHEVMMLICFDIAWICFATWPTSRHGFQSFWWRTPKHDSALDVGCQDREDGELRFSKPFFSRL